MNNTDKYLDMTDDQIDNLLLGLDLNTKIEKNSKICINCKSDKLVIDNIKGHIVCSECGVINEEYLDEKPEFSNDFEGGNSRYGCPSNFFMPKSSLGTKITSKGYNRLKLLNQQGQVPYKEKSLIEVLDNRIQIKCKRYNITQTIIDSAKLLYKRVSESVHSKGKRKGKSIIMRCINRVSMIAACLFYACKLQNETRSPKEIADIYELEIKSVNRGCRNFGEIIDSYTLFCEIKSSQSVDFIERFGKKLNINIDYINIAKNIATNIHKLDIASTHEPPSVAAGCIVLVSNIYNIDISKKEISDIFDISDVTISKTYRKIYPYHNILLSNKVTDLILEAKHKIIKSSHNITKNNLIINKDSESDILDDDTDYDTSSESITKEEIYKVKKVNKTISLSL
jgi:transcription initiation factor TFIIB